MHDLSSPGHLFFTSKQTRFDFMVSALALCHTFLGVAARESELGEMKAAERVLGVVEKGYCQIERIAAHLHSPDQRYVVKQKLIALRKAIDANKFHLLLTPAQPGPGLLPFVEAVRGKEMDGVMKHGDTIRASLRERLSMEEYAISEILTILRTQELSTERRYEILNDLTQRERVRKRILKILGSSNGC